MQQSHSPPGLSFRPRRPRFALARALSGDWHGGSAFRTAWFNAMSMLFPLGEKFFIDSVRAFRHEIDDPRLLAEITAFQGQESTHRLAHQEYNELLCTLRGYDLDQFEQGIRARMEWAYRELSPRRRLAGTAANEHLTAVMAEDMLRHPDTLEGADPDIAALWRWHGIEETEHKSVAFDVYTAVGGTVRERRLALLHTTLFFLKDTFRNLRIMLRNDGKLWSVREWYAGMMFLFIRPGVLRRILFPYLRFWRRNFHPWQHDNRDLIDDWVRHGDDVVPPPRGA